MTVFPGRRWRIHTFDSSEHTTAEHLGDPTSWVVRIALGDGSPQVELVEPVSRTGIHREWLDTNGEGFYHVGIVVDSVADALAELGRPALLSGSGFGIDGSGAYAYVDTVSELGYLVELLEPPTSLGKPDAVREG
jgi:methylmalonyl-CoA/ethylmalonyl-CoA epimerase